MQDKYFMGIDIGTYESKGVLVNEQAEIIVSAACPHNMEIPKPGYAEHDAEKTWWADFCMISNSLIEQSKLHPKQIEAIGCSTIAPCCLPVDRELNPLRKAILYGIDVRSFNEIAYLEELYGKEAIYKKCGTAVTSQSAAAKVLWIKNKEPEVYTAAHKFITGATYLVAKLTGEYVIDHYTAATWVPMYNVGKLGWEDDVSLFCRNNQIAECRWSHQVVGTVHAQASKETGLAVGTRVITGTADASAEAISVGVLSPGDMMLMYGSSMFIIHVVDHFTSDKRLWAGPYLFPGTFSVAAGMSTAGTLTRWYRDQLARDLTAKAEEESRNVYELMADSIQDIPAGSEGLIVLPYFSGERTPINDPKAKGMIIGLNLQHKREHIYNACLEGVGYGISQHFEIFGQLRMDTKKVMAVGGGTKNKKWMQMISDISGKEQMTAQVETGAAYGDALLAAMGVGFYKTPRDVADKIVIKQSVLPNPLKYETYVSYRENFRDLYLATKDIMHRM